MSNLGLKKNEVKVVPYTTLWAKSFENEKKKLLTVKGIIEIQHVGSTSISGMAAKPIIDIIVGIEKYSDFKKYIRPLKKIGYQYKFEPRRYQAYFVKEDLRGRATHYLKILRHNGTHWKKYIHMKRVLTSNKKLFNEYMDLKIAKAKHYHNNRKEYAKAKGVLIEKILSA